MLRALAAWYATHQASCAATDFFDRIDALIEFERAEEALLAALESHANTAVPTEGERDASPHRFGGIL